MNRVGSHSKKKTATETTIRLLVAFIAGLTVIAVVLLFAVWTFVRTIEAAVSRKSRSLKEPDNWFVVSQVKQLTTAIDGQDCFACQEGLVTTT